MPYEEPHALDTDPAAFGRLRTNRASRVLAADGAVAAMLRCEATALVGRPLSQLVAIEERSAFRSRLATLPDDGRIDDWSVTLAMLDGAVRVVAEVVAVGAAASGPASPRTGVTLQWRLVPASRNAAGSGRPGAGSPTLSDVVARLEHELNQPLSAIVTYARGALLRARAGTLPAEDLEQVLSIIVTEAMRVAERLREVGTHVERRS